MRFPHPVIEGTLIQRYKRFLADVRLPGGAVVTAHCANTGSMKTCAETGRPVLLTDHGADCARKLRYTFEAIEMGGHWVGVNTAKPNAVVAEGIQSGAIPELSGYVLMRREVKYGANSRIDLLLSGHPGRPKQKCFVEVKNTTLREGDGVLFPDAVTARGLKHIHALEDVARGGQRAVMFFFVNRTDCAWMGVAEHIDPAYAAALRKAVGKNRVEICAYQSAITREGISIGKSLPIRGIVK